MRGVEGEGSGGGNNQKNQNEWTVHCARDGRFQHFLQYNENVEA